MDIEQISIYSRYHMDTAQLQARIKELEARLEYQKKLSEELQTSLLFDSVGKVKNKRSKYRKDTPLKTYIKTHWNDADVKLKLTESLPGVTVGNISKQLLRAYLSIIYRNTVSDNDKAENTEQPPPTTMEPTKETKAKENTMSDAEDELLPPTTN